MRSSRLLLGIAVCAFCGPMSVLGAESPNGKNGALLGSPDFQPSPERPTGWRGDGSGRYLGATPPVTFERNVVTAISGFRCQAKKPKADEASGAPVSQYAGTYRITEWLALGPVSPANPARALEGEAVPGEAALAPDEGEATAGLKWRRVESVGGVDFGEVFGEKIGGKVGYAVAHFRSDEAFRCAMVWQGHDMKQWLNGAPANGWERARHEIKKGWNRLLVKVVARSNQDAWAFRTHFFPHSDEKLTYRETNIRWARPLPASSWATPVLAGDRIFLTSDPNDLICLDKRNGNLLWVRSNPVWYAAVEADREKPARLELTRFTKTTLTLTANRALDKAGAASPATFSVAGARIAKAELSPDLRTVRLTAAAPWPWPYGTAVTVQCSGLKAANGEAVAGELSFTPWPGRLAGRELLPAFLIGEPRARVDANKVVKTPLLDEAAVRPAEGDAWTRASADEGVFDLLKLAGQKNNAVHACVYLWSDADREAQLWFGSEGGIRAVVNGKPVHALAVGRGCQPDQDKVQGVPLKKGWNTLLLMVSKTGNGWAFCARVMDAAGKEPAGGVCWLAARPEDSRSGLETAPEAGPVADEPPGSGYLDDLRPKIAELDRLNEACVKTTDGSRDEPRRKLAQALSDKVTKADRGLRVNVGWGGGNTGPTPVTDGQRVWAWFGETGVMTCFDLDGRRIWTRFEQPGGGEHGINSSPVLVGRLVALITGDHWVAFDKLTGQVAWRQKYHHPSYGTPVVANVGGEAVLVAPDGQVVRAADGVVVAPSIGKFDGECSSPVLDGNRFFLFARAGFCCAELPAKAEKGAGTRLIRMIEPKVLDPDREPYPVGSPVCHDGLVYAVRSGWGSGKSRKLQEEVVLYLFDPAAPEPLFRQKLDLEPALFYGPEGGGVQASLAFAGGNIYVLDNRGTGLVFKPGREYKQVARFRLDHWMRSGFREVTGSTPIFEGRCIYLRGREMLYCIGEP